MSIRRATSFGPNSDFSTNLYAETEQFIQDAQDQLSQSFHELSSIGADNNAVHPKLRNLPVDLRRRKSAVELRGVTGKHTFFVPESTGDKAPEIDERPVQRRKRYTRKARKSVTIEPSTGIILAAGDQSSSDEGKESKQRSNDHQRLRVLSTSTSALNTPSVSNQPPKLPGRPAQARGPAARRANRRFLQKYTANSGSTGHLEQSGKSPENGLRYEKRSMSVRNLNGHEVDFSNQDHVTRWTSQILAELDSLPSSQMDLTRCGLDDEELDELPVIINKDCLLMRSDSKRNDNKERLSTFSSPALSARPGISNNGSGSVDYRHSVHLYSPEEIRRLKVEPQETAASINNLMSTSLYDQSIWNRGPMTSHDLMTSSINNNVQRPRTLAESYGRARMNEQPMVSGTNCSSSESTPRASPTPADENRNEVTPNASLPVEPAAKALPQRFPTEVRKTSVAPPRPSDISSQSITQRHSINNLRLDDQSLHRKTQNSGVYVESARNKSEVAREPAEAPKRNSATTYVSTSRQVTNAGGNATSSNGTSDNKNTSSSQREKSRNNVSSPPVPARRTAVCEKKIALDPPQPSVRVSERFRRLSPSGRRGHEEAYPHQKHALLPEEKSSFSTEGDANKSALQVPKSVTEPIYSVPIPKSRRLGLEENSKTASAPTTVQYAVPLSASLRRAESLNFVTSAPRITDTSSLKTKEETAKQGSREPASSMEREQVPSKPAPSKPKEVPRGDVEDALERNDRKIFNAVERLSKSVYGAIEPDPRDMEDTLLTQHKHHRSVPTINLGILTDSSTEEDPLSRWTNKAECRSRNPQLLPEKSVTRVVASLIRAAEESRLHAHDRPTSLDFPLQAPSSPLNGQHVSTQTSPFSLSRSSSFDWINDATEKTLKGLKTPVETPRSDASVQTPRSPLTPLSPPKYDSSDETDCDAEVQQMTRVSIGDDHPLDESLEMLLQCAQEQPKPKPKPRTRLPQPSMDRSNFQERRLTANAQQPFSAELDKMPSASKRKAEAPAPVTMSDSVYDNVAPHLKKDKSFEDHQSDLRNVKNDDSLSALAQVNKVIQNLSKTDPPRRRLVERRGSFEQLMSPQAETDTSDAFKAHMRKADDEAVECCQWLINAGFPQYTKQFEENHFPIDLKTVHADHPFLDTDSLLALYQRLSTLNKTAIMRIDNVIMRRRENGYDSPYDFEEEDQNVALSNRWRYQRHSHTWSRDTNEPSYNSRAIASIRPEVLSSSNNGLRRVPDDVRDAEGPSAPREGGSRGHRSLQRSQSERIKERARAFMKKMDIRSSSRRRKPREEGQDLVIGDPVLVSYDSAAPESMRILQSHNGSSNRFPRYVENNGPPAAPLAVPSGARFRSKSAKRHGFVLRSPTSPEERFSPGPPRLPDTTAPEDYYGQVRYSPPHDAYKESRSRRANRTPHDAYLYPPEEEKKGGNRPTISRPFDARKGYGLQPPAASRPGSSNDRRPNRPSEVRLDRPGRPSEPRLDDRSLNLSDDFLLDSSSSTTNTSASISPYTERTLSGGSYANQGLSYANHGISNPAARPSIHPDGYFMHEMSPDSSMSLPRIPRTNTYASGSNPYSKGVCLDARQRCTDIATRDIKIQKQSGSAEAIKVSQSSLDACTDSEERSPQATVQHQRRDSGVGSSLSRSPSGPSAQRVKASLMPASPFLMANSNISYSNNNICTATNNGSWSKMNRYPPGSTTPLASSSLASSVCSKDEDAFFSDVQLQQCIDSLGVVALSRAKKLAYLRVTALLEKYLGSGTVRIGNASGEVPGGGAVIKNWAVQKLIKKIKQYETSKIREDNTVFGHLLETIYKRTGLCLPRSILEVMRFLRQMGPETVGIFRKNGVRSRIQELREIADRISEGDLFVGEDRLLGTQVHDASDMLKQYLRELPEPLMTVKLSETFANIYLHLPENERLVAVQYALLLLPDENREALQTLLFFLHDVAKYSDTNSMTAQNLSVCFTPSLFHLSASRLNAISPTRRHKTICAAGMPTEKEMKETRAAQACLTSMIQECRRLFIVPECLPDDCSDVEGHEFPLLSQLGGVGYRSFLVRRLNDLLKEHGDRWKGWASECSLDGVDVASKKTSDLSPLKAFKATGDIDAPPREVLNRIMRERPLWDTQTINWRVLDNLQADTDLYQYVLNDTVGHPTRDCYVVRMHRTDLGHLRGACAVIERSVLCPEAQMLGGVSTVVHDTRVLIEPSSGRSKVTYISRIDLRGRSLSWYSKVYTSTLARQMSRLRDSFLKHSAEEAGPETKV